MVPSLGPLIYEYGYDRAAEEKVISPFEITNVELETDTHARRFAAGAGPRRRIEPPSSLLRRSRSPWPCASRSQTGGARILVFHEKVDSAEEIVAQLIARNMTAAPYHSKMGAALRQNNLRLYRHGALDALVSCRALDEGINVPNTNVAIIAAATRSTRQRIQRLGRALRSAPGKTLATVYTLYWSAEERRRLAEEAAPRLQGVAKVRWSRGGLSANGYSTRMASGTKSLLTALSEAEYERLVLRHAAKWFPTYVAAQFKRELATLRFGRTKPDLVLIHRSYREWWVVEVEMIVHSFRLQRSSAALLDLLGKSDADYLARAARTPRREEGPRHGEGAAPGRTGCARRAEARVGGATAYARRARGHCARLPLRSQSAHLSDRNGDELPQDEAVLSYCVPAKYLSGFLCVESPASLEQRSGQTLRIRTQDGVGEWARRDIADKVYPVPVGGASPHFDAKRYKLLRTGVSGFALQVASN